MKREVDILDAIRDGVINLPPLVVRLTEINPRIGANGRSLRADAFVDVRWDEQVFPFVAEIEAQATPKTFRNAVIQARSFAEQSDRRPLVITPYLAPERLRELEAGQVSGLDLCGNGFVIVPGKVLVVRTGKPNLYPASRAIRNVYQGASALVPRVFLARPRYDSVQAVREEISRRGGRIALSTVSKVLKVLDEDLMIKRVQRTSALLQAAELLDRLASNYQAPVVSLRKKYRWSDAATDLLDRIADRSGKLVLTGAASVERYAVMPREQTIQCYCPSIAPLERELSGRMEETARFADLELIETRDPAVYFDIRRDDGVPSASPVQCWLELQAGDKRQQDAAKSVRNRILNELRQEDGSAR